jgi:hypothetical protein
MSWGQRMVSGLTAGFRKRGRVERDGKCKEEAVGS